MGLSIEPLYPDRFPHGVVITLTCDGAHDRPPWWSSTDLYMASMKTAGELGWKVTPGCVLCPACSGKPPKQGTLL